MISETHKKRLDQILIDEGLVSETDIKEALLRQKARGGKFGSHLLYHKDIDETVLVQALATQFECEGVVLSDCTIPELMTRMIPARVAVARKVMPFEYDPQNNILKIACEDPHDRRLLNEMKFVARGKKIKLFIAAELSLHTAIAKYYLGRDVSGDDEFLLGISDLSQSTGELIRNIDASETTAITKSGKKAILLISDEGYATPLVRSVLEREDYSVDIVSSIEKAADRITDQKYHSVFIRNSISGDIMFLVDKIRKIRSATKIQFFESASSLIMGGDLAEVVDGLLTANLELFTSLLVSKTKMPINHGQQVGQYVGRLCRRMKLPVKDRLMITNAAYIHDIARFYYSAEDQNDSRRLVELTIRLLKSVDYPLMTRHMLGMMYSPLPQDSTERMPVEVLGANIITIVDLYCENLPTAERLSLDKFDAVETKLRDFIGKLFIEEIVEQFVEMIKADILNTKPSARSSQVMIYAGTEDSGLLLEGRLKAEGFRIIIEEDIEAFLDLYKRSQPEILILAFSQNINKIKAVIDIMEKNGLDFGKTPTFILTETLNLSGMTGLIDRGFEDIIPIDDNLDFLVTKLRKYISRSALNHPAALNSKDRCGVQGRLTDMNLAELLQALGPSRKTVKIMIEADECVTDPATIYLCHGQLRYAECGSKTGDEVISGILEWEQGGWTVEPIEVELIPVPNITGTNESILGERCRTKDSAAKAKALN